jgi:hypothetical protein
VAGWLSCVAEDVRLNYGSAGQAGWNGVPHLRRSVPVPLWTQRLRAGLISAAPCLRQASLLALMFASVSVSPT